MNQTSTDLSSTFANTTNTTTTNTSSSNTSSTSKSSFNTSTKTTTNITSGSHTNQNRNVQNLSHNNNNESQISYAKALKKSPNLYNDNIIVPTKDQGIILNSLDGIKIESYIECIAALVEPENIIFASRLSHDRISMYLKTKEIAQQLTDTYNTVIIDDKEIELRPLITKAKKYFLSNVPPIIPNSHLHEEIEKQNIKITSPIQYTKVGCTNPKLMHVLSNRRTFYGLCETQLNDSLLIQFDNNDYRIFITNEPKKCTNCQKYGHNLDKCPKIIIENEVEPMNYELAFVYNEFTQSLMPILSRNIEETAKKRF